MNTEMPLEIEMKSLIFKMRRSTTFMPILGIFALAISVGCCSEKSDSAASSTTATNPSTTTTTNPGSRADNRVLRLDGKTASMRVPDSPSMHSLTNAVTIELWFKAASFYSQNGAVNSLMRKNVEAGSENFFLRFRIMWRKPTVEMSCANEILQAPYDFQTNAWYHLAGTYDEKSMTAFVNGVAIGSQPLTAHIAIDDSEVLIGKGDPNYSMGEYFHGDIDDIRIWNVARSPEQIRAAMNTRLTGKEAGLVAYWTFEDGTAKDLSANGNTGSLDGEARIVYPASADMPAPNSSQKR